MTKHAFTAYVLREQKRYLRRHLVIKSRSMKLHIFISRLQELNAYLEEFPPDTEGQETTALPADEIIYHIPFHANYVVKQKGLLNKVAIMQNLPSKK